MEAETQTEKQNATNSWYRRYKWLLFSFFIPFVIATAGYHFVYICDAGIRSTAIDYSEYPGVSKEKALELEEGKRLRNVSAWAVHALVFGIPAGLLVSVIVIGTRFSIRLIRSQTKDDVA